MAPRSAPAELTGRTLPAITLVAGSVAGSNVLLATDVEALAVPVAPAGPDDAELQPRTGTADAAARYGIDLAEVAERAGLTGEAGQTWSLHLPRPLRGRSAAPPALPWDGLPARVVLVGVGSSSPADLRRAGAGLAQATRGLRRVVTTIAPDGGPESADALRGFVEGYLLASYTTPTQARPASPSVAARRRPAEELVLLGRHGPRSAAALAEAVSGAGATWLVRDLANTPSSTKTPGWMADRAVELARGAGLAVHVRGPRELDDFGGIRAVGAGSAATPRLVTVEYVPAGARRHVVVVGKGITFDTGGLAVKPRTAMATMKTDMAGAAVALATVLGAAAAGVAHRVTAVLPLAENQVGAASYRPGDVLRMYGGRTVEVADTDAEGRLVLADALAWAAAELHPDVLVDVATLTGAASVGLGTGYAALYGTDPALVAALQAAGDRVGEPAWPMPLVEDYVEALRSDVADLRNVGHRPGPGGGSITAALFLRPFTAGLPWAHLDIAGPARAAGDRGETTQGATGFGARLLLRWLADLA